MPPVDQELLTTQHLLKQNAALLQENNELLKKIHRNAVWGFWVRIVWYTLLFGLPLLVYFYVLEPYFFAIGSSYENFIDGLNELPGFRGIDQLMNGGSE